MSCCTWCLPTAAIDAAVADVRFFLGAIEGIGDVALSGLVLPFPALQADPYCVLTPHMRVSSARARALLAMATGAARVVVASAPALLQRLPSPSLLVARLLGVRTGAEIDPLVLSTLLAEAGYDRQDPVDDHGEDRVRGGILDVYPPDEIWPIRIEFIGDLVELIRRFDPGTQRSVETLDQFLVVPVREQVEGTLATAGVEATLFEDPTAAISWCRRPPAGAMCRSRDRGRARSARRSSLIWPRKSRSATSSR